VGPPWPASGIQPSNTSRRLLASNKQSRSSICSPTNISRHKWCPQSTVLNALATWKMECVLRVDEMPCPILGRFANFRKTVSYSHHRAAAKIIQIQGEKPWPRTEPLKNALRRCIRRSRRPLSHRRFRLDWQNYDMRQTSAAANRRRAESLKADPDFRFSICTPPSRAQSGSIQLRVFVPPAS